MIKEAVEDYKRHRQDVEVNNRKVQVFSHATDGFVEKTWKDIQVGDVIIVHKDEFFPAGGCTTLGWSIWDGLQPLHRVVN